MTATATAGEIEPISLPAAELWWADVKPGSCAAGCLPSGSSERLH